VSLLPASGGEIAVLPGHEQEVWSAAFSPEGSRGIGVLPVFAGLIGLLLLFGSLPATWMREGR